MPTIIRGDGLVSSTANYQDANHHKVDGPVLSTANSNKANHHKGDSPVSSTANSHNANHHKGPVSSTAYYQDATIIREMAQSFQQQIPTMPTILREMA
jgi:hypothetical protein